MQNSRGARFCGRKSSVEKADNEEEEQDGENRGQRSDEAAWKKKYGVEVETKNKHLFIKDKIGVIKGMNASCCCCCCCFSLF